MGIFDQIKGAADQHEEQVEAAIDQAGDYVDTRTGGQYAGHVDQAQDALKDRIGVENPVVEPSGDPGQPA